MLSQSSSQAEVDDNLNDNDDVQPTASVTNSAPPHANDNNIHVTEIRLEASASVAKGVGVLVRVRTKIQCLYSN